MYFSHNVQYHYTPVDRNNPKLGRQFLTLEEIARIDERREDNKIKENRSKEEEFEVLMQQDFTEEELKFLKEHWKPTQL